MEHAEIVVDGVVQGVGFRHPVAHIARELGLAGHIKNLDDGTAEIVCEGSREAIDALVGRIRVLDPPVEVSGVKITHSGVRGFRHFEIICGSVLEELVEGFSTQAAIFHKHLAKDAFSKDRTGE